MRGVIQKVASLVAFIIQCTCEIVSLRVSAAWSLQNALHIGSTFVVVTSLQYNHLLVVSWLLQLLSRLSIHVTISLCAHLSPSGPLNKVSGQGMSIVPDA